MLMPHEVWKDPRDNWPPADLPEDLNKILDEYFSDRTTASKGDGTGTRTTAHRKAVRRLKQWKKIDPFDFIEPCVPDCTPERHAYHKGQWDMAMRIKEDMEKK